MFQQKVLCLGTNSQDTDVFTFRLAAQNNTLNHGLIDKQDFVPQHYGYYHTTVVDLPVGAIHQLAKHFDLIVLLDQPYEAWSNWKLLNTSYKLLRDLDNNGHNTQYKDNKNIESLKFFDQVLNQNKSFCIHPWINFTEENGGLKLCPRDQGSVLPLHRIDNWNNTAEYKHIQQRMLAGEKITERCGICYEYENIGTESYRQYETLEWLVSLDIKSFKDLEKINHPYFYEIRLNNKCNIQCRSCNPLYSHLIDREAKLHNIVYAMPNSIEYSSISRININELQSNSRVYLTGGEPTIMAEVLEFMRQCIAQGRTDFELTFGTNGVKFSNTFLKLCSNFSKLNFSFSLDGYKKINDYWRWGSNWENIVKNMHAVKNQGHIISVNTVPGIYNVTNLHLLFEWLDIEFPEISIYLQFNYFKPQSAFNHPNHDMVMESMRRCMNTQVYLADGKSTKTGIDSIFNHYSSQPSCDIELLKEFFNFNDKLDQIRNTKLSEYIPELEACRHLLQS